MLAAILAGVVTALLTNLVWVIRHRRVVKSMEQSHKDELYVETRRWFADGFKAGWDAVLMDYFVMKNAIEKLKKRMEEE